MNLLYHFKTESWYYPEAGWRFGGEMVPKGTPSDSCRFLIQKKGNRIGPLVGILTSGLPEGKIYGDWKRFFSIQAEMQKKGGISFVFTPYGMKETYIEGYTLLPNQRWRKCRFPYPDAVYNRIPYRTHEESAASQQALTNLANKSIPLFNPGFFSKWDVHRALQHNPFLQKHLLHTEPLYEKEALSRMLHKYHSMYIKQADASKGKQLFRVQRSSDHVLLEPVHGTRAMLAEEEVWNMIQGAKRLFLAQSSLPHDEQDGKKYDLRVLAHFLENSFEISGVGVRLAAADQIVTHVPNGGKIIPVHELSRPVQLHILEQIVQECGKSLCAAFGRIREFSLDIGVDKHGRYYIFEANAKPMSFDEPDIETQALQNLVTVFAQEAGFSPVMT
ncbi:YheC/YheD family protein [Ectobacillus panaciterrae]|uniref:YheC/YheD family endospore coat-associated protein n=1 Tax=Ectobacillus panaciterrae TaxID=363872 RepID=UPI000413C40C|nr:YheC/YheD family protein [Ectobacillus panaciterrae]